MAVNSRIGGFGIPARALGLVGAGYSQAQTATASGVGDVESAEYSHIGAMGMPRVAYPASIPNKYGGAVTITGSGTPTATTATASGVAGLRWNASGTPQATTSTVSGAGARVITGAASAGWFGPHWFGPHWFNDVWFTEAPTADRADVSLSQSSIRLISATVSATRATASVAEIPPLRWR